MTGDEFSGHFGVDEVSYLAFGGAEYYPCADTAAKDFALVLHRSVSGLRFPTPI